MNQNHTLLKNTLLDAFPFLETQEVEEYTKLWTIHRTLKRFDYLTNHGDIEDYLYFIVKGTFRLFYPLSTEATIGFAYPNLFYNAYESFITKEPSRVFLQALSRAEVIGVKKESFEKFLVGSWNFEKAYRMNNQMMLLQRFEYEFLMKLPGPERVQRYLNTNPTIFQLFPHKYIASFLNLTPETLSRTLNNFCKDYKS